MKIRYAIAAALLSLGSLALVTPAQAATVDGCGESTLCLYPEKNEGASPWHSSMNNIHLHTDGGVSSCLDIPPANYPNGTHAYDNSGSLVLNDNTDLAWEAYDVYVYNWTDCNPGGGYYVLHGSNVDVEGDLSVDFYVGAPSIYLYHTITSVKTVLG